jgi:predicted metalloprotease with PDZ domain
VPASWRVATGLAPAGDHVFLAPDYDTFADSPIEISDYAEKTFTESGTTYHVIVHDMMGKRDFTKFTEDHKKIVRMHVQVLGPVVHGPRPGRFEDYWFLFHISPKGGGGLEHLNSTQIFFSSDWIAPLRQARSQNTKESYWPPPNAIWELSRCPRRSRSWTRPNCRFPCRCRWP